MTRHRPGPGGHDLGHEDALTGFPRPLTGLEKTPFALAAELRSHVGQGGPGKPQGIDFDLDHPLVVGDFQRPIEVDQRLISRELLPQENGDLGLYPAAAARDRELASSLQELEVLAGLHQTLDHEVSAAQRHVVDRSGLPPEVICLLTDQGCSLEGVERLFVATEVPVCGAESVENGGLEVVRTVGEDHPFGPARQMQPPRVIRVPPGEARLADQDASLHRRVPGRLGGPGAPLEQGFRLVEPANLPESEGQLETPVDDTVEITGRLHTVDGVSEEGVPIALPPHPVDPGDEHLDSEDLRVLLEAPAEHLGGFVEAAVGQNRPVDAVVDHRVPGVRPDLRAAVLERRRLGSDPRCDEEEGCCKHGGRESTKRHPLHGIRRGPS